MININEYFDKIYCLNLTKRKDRMETMNERFNKMGIKAERFRAIPGEIVNDFFLNKVKNEINSYFKNANYIATTLSHLAIMRDALDNGYKRILILEDDVSVVECNLLE